MFASNGIKFAGQPGRTPARLRRKLRTSRTRHADAPMRHRGGYCPLSYLYDTVLKVY